MGGGMVSGYQLTVYIMATYSATGVDLACVYCAHLWHGRIASDHVVHHGTWGPVSTHVFPSMQKGHVLRALFCCQRCHQHKRTWSSSRVLGGHYLVNQKYSTKLIIYVLGWPCSSSNLAPFHIILVAQDGSQLHLCWHFGIAVYQPQQVCRPRTVGNAYIRQGISVIHVYCLLRNYWLLDVFFSVPWSWLLGDCVQSSGNFHAVGCWGGAVSSRVCWEGRGKVYHGMLCVLSYYVYISYISGSSLMPGMTPLAMRTTLQYHACQEGILFVYDWSQHWMLYNNKVFLTVRRELSASPPSAELSIQ